MAEKITVIESFTIRRSGQIEVQAASFFVEDGEQLSPAEYHRCVLNPGDKSDDVYEDVKAHMAEMGKPIIPPQEWARVAKHASVK
jgi:hypothetical protein